MDPTTLETLEYPAVLRELSGFCSTAPGADLVLSARPMEELALIREGYGECAELSALVSDSGKLPLGGLGSVAELLAKAAPTGSYLLPEELLKIKDNLDAVVSMRGLIKGGFNLRYPRVAARVEALTDQRPLLNLIGSAIDDKATIKDGASPGLYRVRSEMRSARTRARSLVDSIMADSAVKEILQEELVTIREDRFVLSVVAGKHTELPGVIHGRSNSGATFFIEPFQLVEINNRLALLKKEEKAEEIEVLKAVTAAVLSSGDSIARDTALCAALDAVQARALFGSALGAVIPALARPGEGVEIRGARHPLLLIKEKKGLGAAVPIDIVIGEGKKILVISGANTGGKTVAMKTLGLLTLMAASAIPVPAAEGASVVLFRDIYADIGDRQDIIASLSTFSAHIKRINGFLEAASEGSLVLMDEIGVGTDPAEGSAFALSALETFRERGVTAVVTTHLNLLKAHAQTAPEYMNASVEFDEATLKPLYRIIYGMPGQSLGLMIAESLGTPHEVVARARSYISEKEGAFIESVRILEREKEEVRRIKERAVEIEALRNKAVARLRDDREKLLEKARRRIEQLVADTAAELKEIVERQRQAPASGAKSVKAAEDAGRRAAAAFGARVEFYIPKKGDRVVVAGSNARGVVHAVDEGAKRAEVAVGGLKVWADWTKLSKKGEGPGARPEPSRGRGSGSLDAAEAASTVNIIGMRAEEAIKVLSRFLDDAHSSGLEMVHIVHGVGTGALAKAVREHLAGCHYVKSFRHADQKTGGAGVTVAELK